MTAATAARPAVGTRRGPSLPGVVAAEWTKLTSLRSTWWSVAATVVVGGALTYVSSQASSVDPGFRPTGDLSTGLVLAQVGPLVLGVLVGAGEYATGGFRTTFAAVPRRWPVLVAQAVVTALLGLLTGVLTTAAAVVAVLPAAASRDLPLDLAADGTPGVLAGMVLLVAMTALLGLACGALLRRTVPALVTSLVLLLVLPVALMLASQPAMGPAGEYVPTGPTALGTVTALLPGSAGQLLTVPADSGPVDGAPDLGPVGGGLVLALWIALPLALAAVRLRTRDAT